jgi:3-hydroxybutyryl-CoA dehydrogenase
LRRGSFFSFIVFFQIKRALYCAAAIFVLRRNSSGPGGLFRNGDRTMSFEIRKVGVIGAGQMGKGIAQVSALAGYDVVLNDISAERIDAAVKDIAVQMRKSVERGHMAADAVEAALPHISGAPSLADLGDADLIIEAATENEEVKRGILVDVAQVAKPEAIIASNTSSISITRLAAITGRPERFIGIHFMNPVPRMQLVELIRGIATEDKTFEAAKEYCSKLGKTVTVAEDFPAFIVNRILLPMINEAIYTLYEGVGSVEAIDTAMRLGANHPMGPLQLADFIGLDTCLSVMQVLHEGLADTKYRPCPLLVKYVEAGWLGKKTQRGFYDYRSGTPVPTR